MRAAAFVLALLTSSAAAAQVGVPFGFWAAEPFPQARRSLPLSGGTLTGPLLLPDGTSGAPAIGFASQPGLGLYREGANTITVTGGVFSARGVASGAAFHAGTPGTAFFTVNTSVAPNISTVGSASVSLPGVSTFSTFDIEFCGQGPNGATATFIPPKWQAALFGDATCDGLDNTTESTADLVWLPYDFTCGTMECGCTDAAVDAGGITFSFRDDTATASTDLECTTGAADGAGFIGCIDIDTTPPLIAAGSAIAYRIVATTGNFSTADCWCRLTCSQ